MKKIIIIGLIAGIVLISGCNKADTVDVPQNLIISRIEANGFCRDDCFSNLTIDGDGNVIFTESIGYDEVRDESILKTYSSTVDFCTIRDLYLRFINTDFNKYELERTREKYCRNSHTDAGSTNFEFKGNKLDLTAGFYNGCDWPNEIEKIKDMFDDIEDNIRNNKPTTKECKEFKYGCCQAVGVTGNACMTYSWRCPPGYRLMSNELIDPSNPSNCMGDGEGLKEPLCSGFD